MKRIPIKTNSDKEKTRKAEVLIYDDIGESLWGGCGYSAKAFAEDIKALGELDEINVRVNSAGGSVFDGMAIYNTLNRHPARVVVDVDGMALSAAAVVAMAGDEIRMAANATMMIHNAWGLAIGFAEDMRHEADLLDQLSLQIANVFAARTGMDLPAVQSAMAAETWYTADEADEAGLIDTVTPNKRVAAAKFDPARFLNVPQRLLSDAHKPQPDKMLREKLAQAVRVRARMVDVFEGIG